MVANLTNANGVMIRGFILMVLAASYLSATSLKSYLTDGIKAYLSDHMAQSDSMDIELSWPAAWDSEKIGADSHLETVKFSRNGRYFKGIFNHNGRRLSVRGKVRQTIEVPILLQPLKSGETISDHHLGWVTRDFHDLGSRYIMSREDLIGFSLKAASSQPMNQPILKRNIFKPTLVEKGSLATITFEGAGLKVSNTAYAKKNYHKGDLGEFEVITHKGDRRKMTKKTIYA